ncbi:28S ribosomal protein S22, mitochondrial [Thrips palmi]|uniref:28S ribosomal protein S22, mitochondrial n=1 Tax=Thrips palmi TaxID=161013 RepID=A0A6P8ZMS7_THRPL|nr:28S ribosomal protein S22, mitochondrial [Thrips palmi]
MALASRTLKCIRNINRNVSYLTQHTRVTPNRQNVSRIICRYYARTVLVKTGDVAEKKQRDPAMFFFNDDVQSCLLEMNLRYASKVFEPRKEGQELAPAELKFLTEEELEEARQKAAETSIYYLQLPPVLQAHQETVEILSKDPELQGLEESKILAIDISFGVPDRERLIVARDLDGTLRHASREERSRMIQTYFPDPSRTLEPPALFSPKNLLSLLERSEFEFILDRACAQFEPDDVEYVSITSQTYDYIEENGKFEYLVGTRHYGSLAFYLAFYGKLDRFLNHCISSRRIEDAVSAVNVFYLCRPSIVDYKKPSSPDDSDFIKAYITSHAKEKGTLSMTLNAYLELHLPTAADEAKLSS